MSSGAGASAGEPVITCAKCGAEIKLTETLAAPMLVALRQRYEAEKPKLVEQAKLEAKRDFEARLKESEETSAGQQKQIAELRKNELDLRRERQKLEEAQRALELDVARRLDAEKSKVRESALKEFGEQQRLRDDQQRLRDAEKDKLAADLKQQIDDLKRKIEQGSQQLQGEVQELDLEARLREQFPRDTIEPVAKGQHGGDCVQRVYSPGGALAGSILWESKRTKAWSDGWLPKLRDDQRAAKADVAVLLTQTLPKDVERFGQVDGVCITDAASAFPLAVFLRERILEVHSARQATIGQRTKSEILYAFVTGPEFGHRVGAIIEAFQTLRSDLDKERAWMLRQWAKREKELGRVIEGTAGMYGDLQGIAGKALPAIEGLDANQLESGAEDTPN